MVDEEGRVRDARVLRTSGRAFDAPTLHAVSQLRFRPASLDGHPVGVWAEQPIDWQVVGPPAGMPPRPSYAVGGTDVEGLFRARHEAAPFPV